VLRETFFLGLMRQIAEAIERQPQPPVRHDSGDAGHSQHHQKHQDENRKNNLNEGEPRASSHCLNVVASGPFHNERKEWGSRLPAGLGARSSFRIRNSPLKKRKQTTAARSDCGRLMLQMTKAAGRFLFIGIFLAAFAVVALMIWQGLAAHGSPDPLQPNTTPGVAIMDIGVLVFREGLECILVLAAITASMTGEKRGHRRPVALGAGLAFLATLVTWFIAVRIMGALTESVPALDLQAATGLLAVVVLLVIMNWFFHKIYWGGWIRAHNRRRKSLLANASASEISRGTLVWGLVLLGFTSLYREGFEVVLFLQTYNLRLGGSVVLQGTLLGLILSGLVAVLTFVLQQRLPYRKMLISTGILLGVVLLVMVGEQAQEMQLAHWISKTDIPWLVPIIPPWLGLWFAVFPTYETLLAQGLAAIVVVGSYFAARRVRCTSEAEVEAVPPVKPAVLKPARSAATR
jgi:high-affinity iron transporter